MVFCVHGMTCHVSKHFYGLFQKSPLAISHPAPLESVGLLFIEALSTDALGSASKGARESVRRDAPETVSEKLSRYSAETRSIASGDVFKSSFSSTL